MKSLQLILIGTLLLCAGACTNNVVYSEFIEIPQSSWNFDSTLNFAIEIKQPIDQPCNAIVYILHEKNYSYQNLWFYVNKTVPNAMQKQDTIECYLADQRGKWLGSGHKSIIEMPVLIEQNIQIKQTGTYNYQVQHAMREDELKGIRSIGIKIEKTN